MQERLNVKITMDIATPEGLPWHRVDITYSDLPIGSVVALEEVAIEALANLAKLGGGVIEQTGNATRKP